MVSGISLEGTWFKHEFQRKELTDYDNLPEGFELTGKEVDGHKVVTGKEYQLHDSTYEGEWVNGW